MKSSLLLSVPKQVLLHSCCAPCSAAVIEWLLQHNVQLLVFFFNPNIYPEEEYLIRKKELEDHCRRFGVKVIDGDWSHDKWREAVKGLENEPERGARCLECFKYRLVATAHCAKENKIEFFTTTLASSRWKALTQVNEAGIYASNCVPGTTYWAMNWRKGGLQERRGQLLKKYGFYNQQYCGCEFSMARLNPKN
ncbi:MAG: epoxyqueuosine reductase QueH [Burkholderiales bacterium]|nr:epoxyqueuosine reductase QueH [Burkholderiales bacterium]